MKLILKAWNIITLPIVIMAFIGSIALEIYFNVIDRINGPKKLDGKVGYD